MEKGLHNEGGNDAMKDVVVITGGGSGMGLAAAKYMSKEKIIVLSGRTVSKLEKAVGKLEEKEGSALIPFTAEERMGMPEELGYAIATAVDERNGYLAGVDILCDGGSTNGKKFKK